MRKRCLSLLIFALLLVPAIASAQIRSGGTDEPGRRSAGRISVITHEDGERTLVIRFPWQAYKRPSVEVRLLTGEDRETATVRPMFFVEEYMAAEVLMTLGRCEDEAAGVEVYEPLELMDSKLETIEFEVIGRKNWLTKPSVCVIRRYIPSESGAGASVIFPLLPAWSMDKEQLYLDLFEEDFAKPGKLYIWFLRDDMLLWEETMDWPGREEEGEVGSGE